MVNNSPRILLLTDNTSGDAPMLRQLLAQIPKNELLHSFGADGAYDINAYLKASNYRRATAIILRAEMPSPGPIGSAEGRAGSGKGDAGCSARPVVLAPKDSKRPASRT